MVKGIAVVSTRANGSRPTKESVETIGREACCGNDDLLLLEH